MLVVKVVLFFVVAFRIPLFVNSYEYCSKESKLCHKGRHIVCSQEQLTPQAEFERYIPMTDIFRNWILYWHNTFRNDVACGRVNGKNVNLPSARAMRELSWDYEIEYIAKVHAGRCSFKHDQCRNTNRIPISGQNLYLQITNGPAPKAFSVAHKAIKAWFEEHIHVSTSMIDQYPVEPGNKIGHFTLMANDNVSRVGCALTQCKTSKGQQNQIYYLMTCNYDYTNVKTTPVYQTGESASSCITYRVEKSSNFSCLCGSSF